MKSRMRCSPIRRKRCRAFSSKLGLTLGVLAGAAAGYNLSSAAGLADTVATIGLQLPNSRQAESELTRSASNSPPKPDITPTLLSRSGKK